MGNSYDSRWSKVGPGDAAKGSRSAFQGRAWPEKLPAGGRSAGAAGIPVSPGPAGTVQLTRIGVGFDRYGAGGAADVLVTSGLYNCIAIVAYDPATRCAVMAHYDTNGHFNDNKSVKNPEKLAGMKAVLTQALATKAGRAVNPRFHVGLGQIWTNVGDGGLWDMRYNLMVALRAIFGQEPSQGGETIEFDIGAERMTGSFSVDGVDAKMKAPEGSAHSGTEIKYDALDMKDEDKKKACFLTTACVAARGLPDDCDELTVLRGFRDGYLAALPEGSGLIREYYAVAPRLVERIRSRPDAAAILDGIYAVVVACVRLIRDGAHREALDRYRALVLDLQTELEPHLVVY